MESFDIRFHDSLRTRIVDTIYIFIYLVKHFLANIIFLSRYRLPKTLGKYKKSDILFIMGSGSSLNELTETQWNVIKTHDIAGASFSCLLDLEHTFYFYEASPNTQRANSILRQLNKRFREQKIETIIFKDRPFDESSVSTKGLPDFMVLPETIITTNDIDYFNKILGCIIRLKLHRYFYFKKRATIFATALFGVALGYKKIVFCGVDLNDTRYFFEDVTLYPEHVGLTSGQDEAATVHKTVLPDLGIPVDVAIQSLTQVAKHVGFYVASKRSKLAEFLDVYEF